ncbi:MAG TPA: cupin domain-containing protein [Sedimenticola thiotaurini]|uniref:Cupin domain-containing protein n=1 Tax=Sedimenticola thiotaurini TaxID=1543721 RepID=A0A831RP47_9GAMM|nr:cupin domain-containing protein [Sedimenticola thiotaurini]
MELRFDRGLTPATFLREHWQKRPLLVRNALPDYRFPLTAAELAGLACEEEIESRLVLEKDGVRPWEARHGPFDETDFASLPDSHWTLLLQDLDKFVPELWPLLESFRLVPDWRLDDIMVSYAVDQGSVGPHVDDYDVFLLQVAGHRRWRIHTRPVSDDDCIPDLDLRILAQFEAEQEWLLRPGDLLYLPPNVAHWGIAEGDGCITCSIGFRAPAHDELVAAWCQHLIDTRIPAGRYRDPELEPQSHPAEITADALNRIGDLLQRFLQQDPAEFQRWFGRFITESKPHLQTLPPERSLSPEALLRLWQDHETLWRNPLSRFAFIRGQGQSHHLYAGGDEIPVPQRLLALLERITERRRFDYTSMQSLVRAPGAMNLLCRLYNRGHLQFDHDRT